MKTFRFLRALRRPSAWAIALFFALGALSARALARLRADLPALLQKRWPTT